MKRLLARLRRLLFGRGEDHRPDAEATVLIKAPDAGPRAWTAPTAATRNPAISTTVIPTTVAAFDLTEYAIGSELERRLTSEHYNLVTVGPLGPFDGAGVLVLLVPVSDSAVSTKGSRLLTALTDSAGATPLRTVVLVWVIESADRFGYSQASEGTNFAELLTGASWQRELVQHPALADAVSCRERRITEFVHAAYSYPGATDLAQVLDVVKQRSLVARQGLVVLADEQIHGPAIRTIGWQSVLATVAIAARSQQQVAPGFRRH